MGVLLRKPSDTRIIVPRPEIIRSALYIEVFATIAEGVGVGSHAVFFIAEGVVIVGLRLCSGSIDKAHHIPVGVEGVIFGCGSCAGNQIRAAEVRDRKFVILQLCNDIPAVQQVARQRVPRQLRRADAILW